MVEQTRFWFKVSTLYLQGPFTMAGVLATSWEEAKERLMEHPETNKHFCFGEYAGKKRYFLSANTVEVGQRTETREHEHWNCPVVLQLPKGAKKARKAS